MEEHQQLLIQARQLTVQLEEAYIRLRRHTEEMAEYRQEAKKGLAGLLQGIFPMPQPMEPEHQRFFENVQELTEQLAQVLASMPADEERQGLAHRAVACILAPKPLENKNPEEWFMTAADGLSVPLLPYLSRADLEQFRADLLANTPSATCSPSSGRCSAKWTSCWPGSPPEIVPGSEGLPGKIVSCFTFFCSHCCHTEDKRVCHGPNHSLGGRHYV